MLEMYPKLYPISLLDELRNKLSNANRRTNNRIPKFIFLCGESIEAETKSYNRNLVKHYFEEYARKTVFPIFVENLWEITEAVSSHDLLTYEHFLAEICDNIILFMESYGTAAELGSFTSLEEVMNKLIVINDKRFKDNNSFITQGPLRKIEDKNKNSSNIVYCNLRTPFESRHFNGILKNIVDGSKTSYINKDKEKDVLISSYLLEILDIISVLGPVKIKHVIELYKDIKGYDYGGFDFSNRKFQSIYAIEILLKCKLLLSDNNYLKINPDHYEVRSNNLFMFDMSSKDFNRIRSKFIARKYRHDFSKKVS